MVSLLLQRLLKRGHHKKSIAPLFQQAITKVVSSKMPNPIPSENRKKQKTTNSNNNNTIILHPPYHQNNPTKQELHHLIDIFKKEIKMNFQLNESLLRIQKPQTSVIFAKNIVWKAILIQHND